MTTNSKEYKLEYYYLNKEKFIRHCEACNYTGINIAKHVKSKKHLQNIGEIPVIVPKTVMNAMKLVEEYQKSLA